MKKFPFKFLDAYNKDDKEIFFGREAAVEELYRLIFQANLMLVYGASGTGKTSLIRCGLANRFKPSQWKDLYIRRGTDINQSLLDTIVKYTPAAQTAAVSTGAEEEDWFESVVESEEEAGNTEIERLELQTENPAAHALQALYLATFTPIYLIFDQFEELYTLGHPKEQQQFTETIAELVKLPLPVRIIIVMREEYLARLYDLEKAVPQLRHKKLRVAPMDLPMVEQVILSATAKNPQSNIELEKGKEKEIAQAIVEKIREGDVNVKLPYLQLFMDRLYVKATGEATDRSRDAHFSLELVQKMGNIGVVLADFIHQQSEHIYQKLALKYPDLPTDIVWQILSPFATMDGTKAPIKREDLLQIKAALGLPDTGQTDELIKEAVAELENSRILRYRKEEQTYEVAHDTLAFQIAEKRSEEEKAYLKARRMVAESFATYQETRTFLSREQLAFVRPYEKRLQREMDTGQQGFLTDSRKKRRRQRIGLWSGVVGAFAVAIMVIAIVVSGQQQTKTARRTAVGQLRKMARMEAVDLDYEATISAIKSAKELDVLRDSVIQTCFSLAQEAIDAIQFEGALKLIELAYELSDSTEKAGRAYLKLSEKAILNLNYDTANIAIGLAAGLNLDLYKEQIAKVYLELAYFHAEAGHYQPAWAKLESAARIAGWPRPEAMAAGNTDSLYWLREQIRQVDTVYHDKLEQRYYPEMVDIEGGTFMMGCDSTIDKDCQGDETLHEATVSDFAIAKYETTWRQYYLFRLSSGLNLGEEIDFKENGEKPAEKISWYDAVAYANWLSAHRGFNRVYHFDSIPLDPNTWHDIDINWSEVPDWEANGYRLPTEAEWEYAAKGGRYKDQYIYSGSDNLDSVGWYSDNSGYVSHPKGEKKPNALDLYDMSGNVQEWCWDWYYKYPQDSPRLDYTGPSKTEDRSRVYRGGTFYDNVSTIRTAKRLSLSPNERLGAYGFRVSRSVK